LSSDIIWRDGFDHLASGSEQNQRAFHALGGGGEAPTTAGHNLQPLADFSRWPTGRGVRPASTAAQNARTYHIRYVLASPLTTATLSFAINRRTSGALFGVAFLAASAVSAEVQIKVRVTAAGKIEVTNNAGTQIAVSDEQIPLDNWAWVSVRVACHSSSGSVRIVIQGIDDKLATGVNTDPIGTGSYTNFGPGNRNTTGESGTSGQHYWMDDFHLSNDILGERRVATLYATSDVLAQWTPNAVLLGNYDRVNQVIPDGDTTYVAADEQGTKDIYGFEALPAGVGDIDGVTLNIVARKEDAGDTRKLTGVIRVADVDYYFADEHTLLTGYADFSSVMPDPPSGPWTEAKLEKFGMDLTVGETSP
jgi:hypothetical protein